LSAKLLKGACMKQSCYPISHLQILEEDVLNFLRKRY